MKSPQRAFTVLRIDASGRHAGSLTRRLSNDVIEALDRARQQIADRIHLAPALNADAP